MKRTGLSLLLGMFRSAEYQKGRAGDLHVDVSEAINPAVAVNKCLIYLPVLLLLGACAEQPSSFKASDMPRFGDADLAMGRSVWMGTCRNCHLLGVAGAPAVTNHQAWSPRIAKGKEKLYVSALGGIRDGQGEIRMPPRGGNPRLSEDQVMRAVDYMVASVNRLKEGA